MCVCRWTINNKVFEFPLLLSGHKHSFVFHLYLKEIIEKSKLYSTRVQTSKEKTDMMPTYSEERTQKPTLCGSSAPFHVPPGVTAAWLLSQYQQQLKTKRAEGPPGGDERYCRGGTSAWHSRRELV